MNIISLQEKIMGLILNIKIKVLLLKQLFLIMIMIDLRIDMLKILTNLNQTFSNQIGDNDSINFFTINF